MASASGFKQATKMQGFYTAASNVYGGVTAAQMQAPARTSGPRRTIVELPGPPGDDACGECHWVWDDELDDIYCSVCGCEYGDCHCADESDYCRCPVGDGVDVWAMMIALALAYGIHGVWKEKKEAIEG